MSDDISALVDIASSPDTTPASAPEEASPAPPEASQASPESPEDVSPDNIDVDGEPEAAPEGDDKPVDARTNPAAVRSALKALRDMGPEFAPIARQLNDSFGRERAYKAVFPKVADAQNARAVLDAVGGHEGLTGLQETVKAIQSTDSKLYSGDATMLDDILEDLKAEGKTEAFGKLAPGFLERLRSVDQEAYFSAMKPHFFQGLRDVGFQNVIQGLTEALAGDQPNIAAARATIANLGNWFEDLKGQVDSASKVNLDPERQAFEQERSKFQTERTQEFQNGVAGSCDSHNNQALGSALKQYLKMPFFKGFSRESIVDIGSGVKQALLRELSQDKAYQTQMDAFFSQKTPNKDAIVKYHQQKVDTRAQQIVKQLIERRYPNYAAKGAVNPGTKKPAAKPANTTDPQSGKVQFKYVTSKPDWNDIDWKADERQTAYITGRARLLNGTYVSWNPKDKR